MSNPADAENARVEKLLMDRLLDRQARFGGRLTTARELRVGDRFLTGAGGSGGDQPETVEELRISRGPLRDTVIYRTADRKKSQWLSPAQGVVILG